MLSDTETTVESHDVEPAELAADSAELPADPDSESAAELGSDRESDRAGKAEKRRALRWKVLLAYALLPSLAVVFAAAAGFLGWRNYQDQESGVARIDALAAAKDTTVALLSYKPDTAERDLNAARDRLTGTFKDSYTQLTRDVVIPGAKQKQITATATVPAVASVSATPKHAVALLYVNQTTVIGGDAPSDSVSTVRVTLDKVDGRWLVAEFDPI